MHRVIGMHLAPAAERLHRSVSSRLQKIDVMFVPLHAVLVFLHLIGLAIGLGAAILADWIVLSRLTFHRITAASAGCLAELSRAVIIGLGLLWITGAALIVYQFDTAPQQLLTNEKVWAKVGIVSVLTINALLLHRITLPQVAFRVGQPLFAMSWRMLAPSTLFAAVSTTSWTFAAYLGGARELNHLVTVSQIVECFVPSVALAWATTLTLGVCGRDAAHGSPHALVASLTPDAPR